MAILLVCRALGSGFRNEGRHAAFGYVMPVLFFFA